MVPRSNRREKRGSVFVIFALSLLGFMGLAALAVDLGAVYSAKAQLQTAADAAALAGVQELESGNARSAAVEYAHMNKVLNKPMTLDDSDAVTGQFNFDTGKFQPGFNPPNAVKVRARRTENSPDGPLELFFGKAIGFKSVSVEAESIAAVYDRIGGVNPAANDSEADLIPFAVAMNDVGHVEDANGTPIDAVDFSIDYGTGEVIINESVDLEVKVLGTQITYGAGGPTVPVHTEISVNNGQSYISLNNGNAVAGGENLDFQNVSVPCRLAMKANANYSTRHGNRTTTLFNSTRFSNTGSPYVLVLRKGDIVPKYQGFDGQNEVTDYLAPYMDPDSREVTIGINDVIFLVEFVDNLRSDAADFQDLVVLCTFTKTQSEVAGTDARFVADVGRVIDFFPEMNGDAPGNFGTVNLDGGSNSTAVLRDQIENGFDQPFRIPTDPGYVMVEGDPGMSNSLRFPLQERVARHDTVLLLVYDQLSGQGANAQYRVPYLVAVQLLDMNLTGSAHQRYVRAKVVELVGNNLLIDPAAPRYSALGRRRMAR